MSTEAFREYAIILFIGWASGISLYLTIALLGIGGLMGWIVLPGNLEVLSDPLVIGAALVMYGIEFVTDKIPYVDSGWDSIHTLIRPLGALTVAYLAGSEHGPAAQMAFAVLAGGVALETHTVKSSVRLAINTSPEPVSNSVASVAEDSALILMYWFFIKHPVWATVIIILFMVGAFFIIRALWRFVLKLFRRTTPETESDTTTLKRTPGT